MQIISIKASKTPNRVWVTFSDHSFIPFFIDDIVKLSLTKNQEIDNSKFQLIIKTCLYFIGREYSLRQIAISPKTEKIISQKLALFFRQTILKYKIDVNNLNINEISHQIITDLKDKNLLNDQDFVNYFVKRNHKKSRQQIIYLLHQYGVAPEFLSPSQPLPESDVNKIKTLLAKKNLDKSKLSDYNEKNKIKAGLFRRGFNISDINTAFDEWLNIR